MPYTPPSQRSPASSLTSSPVLTRNHSYIDPSIHLSATPQRSSLPRSVSSTAYLNKSRRSPSFETVDNTAANGATANGSVDISPDASRSHGRSTNGSIRPSPPPVNNLLIPSGAITTPPDSSDDEERGRNIGNLRELQEALQHIDVKRLPSPIRNGASGTPNNTPLNAARSLSVEARKISHLRSASEITLSQHMIHPLHTEPVISSSDGSDAEDDGLRMKPLLLRKKSGELVKPALRPPSRRRPSSMPGTPTYSKAVHFNEDIEQVRHFLQVDKPIAVSASSSPVETYDSESEYPFHDNTRTKTPEWDITLTNFPTSESYERQTAPVRVERIFLASDNQTMVGSIACANISFHKLVVARFTLDYWKTTSEVVAEYNHDVRRKQKDDGYDRFNFNIKLADLANLESKTLLVCVRYSVNGQEFWDNNGSMNYQVDFSKKTKQRESKRSPGGLGAIPRSRHSPLAPRPRSMPPSLDDDFAFDFGGFNDLSNNTIKLKPRTKRGSLFPDQGSRPSQAGLAFSTRYDFGASLSAALSSAQTTLGERSGLKINTTDLDDKSYFDRPVMTTSIQRPVAPLADKRPDSLSLEKPDLQSAEYNELIQKFCFFGTPSGKVASPVATPGGTGEHVGLALDYALDSGFNSTKSSATNSPPSPAIGFPVSEANDANASRSSSPFLSRSTSPGPITGTGPDDHIASPYQYGFNNHGGMFNERSHTPTACV